MAFRGFATQYQGLFGGGKIMKTMEQLCRELLAQAVTDGLVVMADDVRPTMELSAGDLTGMAGLLASQAQLLESHVIDCDSEPFCREGWSVEEHIKGGQLKWNPNRLRLWQSERQKDGTVGGNELQKQLKDQPVLNANVLRYLLKMENWHLIPTIWREIEVDDGSVCFWGTIYRDSVGNLFVNTLCCDHDGWFQNYKNLNDHWDNCDFAVVSTAG